MVDATRLSSQMCARYLQFLGLWLSLSRKNCCRHWAVFADCSSGIRQTQKMAIWIEALTRPLDLWAFLGNGFITCFFRHAWRCDRSWSCCRVIPVGSLQAQSSYAVAMACRPQSSPFTWRSTSITSNTSSASLQCIMAATWILVSAGIAPTRTVSEGHCLLLTVSHWLFPTWRICTNSPCTGFHDVSFAIVLRSCLVTPSHSQTFLSWRFWAALISEPLSHRKI